MFISFAYFAIALEQDGFGVRPFFEAYVALAKESNQIVGFALYFFTYSTWVITHAYTYKYVFRILLTNSVLLV